MTLHATGCLLRESGSKKAVEGALCHFIGVFTESAVPLGITLGNCASFPRDCATFPGDCAGNPGGCAVFGRHSAAFPSHSAGASRHCAAFPHNCAAFPGHWALLGGQCAAGRGRIRGKEDARAGAEGVRSGLRADAVEFAGAHGGGVGVRGRVAEGGEGAADWLERGGEVRRGDGGRCKRRRIHCGVNQPRHANRKREANASFIRKRRGVGLPVAVHNAREMVRHFRCFRSPQAA